MYRFTRLTPDPDHPVNPVQNQYPVNCCGKRRTSLLTGICGRRSACQLDTQRAVLLHVDAAPDGRPGDLLARIVASFLAAPGRSDRLAVDDRNRGVDFLPAALRVFSRRVPRVACPPVPWSLLSNKHWWVSHQCHRIVGTWPGLDLWSIYNSQSALARSAGWVMGSLGSLITPSFPARGCGLAWWDGL